MGMCATLTVTLSCDETISRRATFLGPFFQGFLMQTIGPEYAAVLHQSAMHPYRQYCVANTTELTWVVTALTDEAVAHIIVPLEESISDVVTLKALGSTPLPVVGINRHDEDLSQMVRDFYRSPAPELNRIDFVTPTSFKRSGK